MVNYEKKISSKKCCHLCWRENHRLKTVSLVLKPMTPDLDWIPNLITVSPPPGNVIAGHRSGIFCSAPARPSVLWASRSGGRWGSLPVQLPPFRTSEPGLKHCFSSANTFLPQLLLPVQPSICFSPSESSSVARWDAAWFVNHLIKTLYLPTYSMGFYF